MFLWVVQGNTMGQMLMGCGQFPHIERRHARNSVGIHEERRVLGALGQSEKLLSQVLGLSILRPQQIEGPQASEDGNLLRRLVQALVQFQRPVVGLLHLGGSVALYGHQGRAQTDLQPKFLRGTLRSVGQGLEQRQRLVQVRVGLLIGRHPHGSLSRQTMVVDGLLGQGRVQPTRSVEVEGQLAGQPLHIGCVDRFHRLPDSGVQVLPAAERDFRVDCLLNLVVSEGVVAS